MNPVLLLMRNNVDLTLRCIDSVKAQNVPTSIYVIDNETTEDTQAITECVDWYDRFDPQLGVSAGWNTGLEILFAEGAEHVLALNNDAIIPPWFYRTLLEYHEPFITGVAVDVMPTEPAPECPLTPNPDFSAFLIYREAWEEIGRFDETMKIYCSDCDYHIRAHRLGIPLWKANVPYYHVNSQTLKRADPADRAAIETQANLDRERFRKLYGCLPGTREYEEMFK